MMENLTTADPSVIASRFINQTNKSVFLTGKAGTGKTTFLKAIMETTHKKTVVVAPTGIAAINAGGVTIHSQFQLPFGSFLPTDVLPTVTNPNITLHNMSSIKRQFRMSNEKRRTLQSLELLIIDEVSMLRADILDAIDAVLRFVRHENYTPFGGVQVLFIGDLMQLPPVVKSDEWAILRDYYDGMFFFHAKVLQEEKPQYIELEKIYRQNDAEFINILENLRNNRIEPADLVVLNRYYKPDFKPTTEDSYITLTTHNARADQQNQAELEALTTPKHTFSAAITDDFPPHSFPVEKELVLKVGAQIIFIKNDPTGRQRFFNGKIARVERISTEGGIEVRFKGDKDNLTLELYEWRNIKYTVHEHTKEIDEETIGTFTQYPVKLAWAITVHKSQGLTFERAVIDVNSAFAPGQVYVALSRLTSLDGLVLSSKINFNGISNDAQVVRFAANKKAPDELNGILEVEIFAFLKTFLYKTFDFLRIINLWNSHVSSYDKSESHSEKQKHVAWAVQQRDTIEEMKKHAVTFVYQLRTCLETSPPNLTFTAQRLAAAKDYFSKTFESVVVKTRTHKEKMRELPRTKEYQEELTSLEIGLFAYLGAFRKAVVLVQGILEGREVTKADFQPMANENWAKPIENSDNTVQNTEGGISEIRQTVSEKPSLPKASKAIQTQSVTCQLTYELYLEGKSPRQIAQLRGFTEGTIFRHLMALIVESQVDVKKLMNVKKFDTIIEALDGFDGESITSLKEKLGEDYSFDEIRLVKTYLETH